MLKIIRMWVVLELLWAVQWFLSLLEASDFPMKGQSNQLRDHYHPSSPVWVWQPSQSHLFSDFLPPPPPLKHNMKLWKSHFLSNGSWLPRVTGLQESYLSPGRFYWLQPFQEGGAKAEREMEREAGRTKSPQNASFFSSRNGAPGYVRMFFCGLA